jgi:hypothetical protein
MDLVLAEYSICDQEVAHLDEPLEVHARIVP